MNMAMMVRYGWAVTLLLCLLLLPGLAQDDGSTVLLGDEKETLTDLPSEPVVATAPGGKLVLDFTPESPDKVDVGALASEILARPEFQQQVQPAQESLLERLLRWLSNLPGLGSIGVGNWYYLGLLAIVLGLLAYLIVRIAWSGFGRRKHESVAKLRDGKRSGGVINYIDEADQAAQRQDYRQAVRYRFLAMLQQAGVPDNQLLTNRQVRHRLAERNRRVERPLVELISGYEDAWYGGLPCTVDTYGGLVQQAEQVERLLEQEAAA